MNWIISFFVIFFFFCPDGALLYVGNVILFVFFYLKREYRFNKSRTMLKRLKLKSFDKHIIYSFLLFALFSFFANMEYMKSGFAKEAFRLFVLCCGFYLFPFSIRTTNKQIVWTFFSVIVLVFISQIAFVYNISPIVRLVDTYFPYDGEALGLTSDYLLSHSSGSLQDISGRYSGLYRNPNQCGRYMTLAFAALLTTKGYSFQKMFIAVIVCVSSLLTGSRTTFFIFVVVSFFWLYYDSSTSKNKKKIMIYLTIPIIIYQFLSFFQDSSLRVTKISEGVGAEGSFYFKFKWFLTYLENNDSLIAFFIGHGSCVNVSDYGIPLLDSEWGMVFFSYGLIGIILYLLLLYTIIRRTGKNLRLISFIYLWALSSTVLLSYRTSILILLVSSIFYWKEDECVKNFSPSKFIDINRLKR